MQFIYGKTRFCVQGLLPLIMTTVAACSGSVTAPDRTGSVASRPPVSAGAVDGRRQRLDFDLGNGLFTITTDVGMLSGDYVGHVVLSPSGRVDASLELAVTGGTGAYQGATGSLSGAGEG